MPVDKWTILAAVVELQGDNPDEPGNWLEEEDILQHLGIDSQLARDYLEILTSEDGYLIGTRTEQNVKILHIRATPRGRLALKGHAMNISHEEIRDQILKVMYELEEEQNIHIFNSLEIAEKLGLEDKDVKYHFEVLERDGEVKLTRTFSSTSGRLTASGKQRVLEGYRPQQLTPQINIGNVISQMLGGNVQGVGVAEQSEIKQIVNDPEVFQSRVDELVEEIIETVKGELSAAELVPYLKAAEDLRYEITEDEPQPSRIRNLLSTLAFLGDVEGSIGLMTRVWPYLYMLITLASAHLP